jgi:uncharacterized protein
MLAMPHYRNLTYKLRLGYFWIELRPQWRYQLRKKRLLIGIQKQGFDEEGLWQDRTLFGQLLETFVFQELRRLASWHTDPVSFFHLRDKDGVEVDLVLESGGRLAGIEIKASSTVTAADFRSLTKLKNTVGKRFAAGVVLYDGDAIVPFGEALYAVPVCCLWQRG